ncbi:PTPc [Nesidiocoris tenuis]|uniref:protein-tyrosine-phosphatase n=1 Tax=Nesidiocoris tenuis TaxID=355587 RepID=A0ABN7AQ83_9HEMI|nr:PTPc [Nesidiocoris tenuis]
MLAYQAISSTERGGSGEPLNSATGWALASLGPPKNSTSKRIISSQTPKPFNSYWSTRLNKIRPTTPSTQFDAPKPASRECNGTCSETPTENFIQKESENESSLRPNTPVKSTDISLPEPTLRTNELNRKVTRVPPLFKKIDNSTEDRPLSYAANSIPIIGNNLLKEAKSGDLGSSILNGVLATSVYKYVDRTANEETGSTLEKSQPTTERPKITGDCNTTTSSSVNGNVSVSEPTPVINYTTTLATGRIETSSSRNDSESSTPPTVMTLLPTESASDPGASSAPSIKTTTNAEIAIESLLKSTEGSVDVSLETHKSAESTTGTSYNSDHTLPNTSETPTMSVGVSSSTVSSERISRVNVTESSVMNATTPLTELSSSSTDLPEEAIPTEPLTNSSIPKLNTTAVHQASTTTSTTEPTPTPTAATVITVASVRSDSPPAMNVSEIPTTTSPQTTLPLEANDIPEAITLLKPLAKQNHSSTSPAPATTPSIENLTEKSPPNDSVQNQTHAIGSVTTVEPKEPSTAKASTASRNVEIPSDQTTMESTTRHVELDENRILPGSVTTLKPSSPVTEAAKEKDTPEHLETTISADEVDVSYSSDDTPAKDVPDRTTLPPITVLPSSVPSPVEVTTVKQVTKGMVNSSTEKYNTSTSIFDLDEKNEDEDDSLRLKYNVTMNLNATDQDDHNDYSDHNEKEGEDDSEDVQTTTTLVVIEEITTTKQPTTSTTVTTTSTEPPTTPEVPPEEDISDKDSIPSDDSASEPRLRLTFQASFKEMCLAKESLPESISTFFASVGMRPIPQKQVKVLNLEASECSSKALPLTERVPVIVQITDVRGKGDHNLTDALYSQLRQNRFDFKYQLTGIELGARPSVPDEDAEWGGTVIAAIVVSSVAGLSLLCLTILLVIMRKRQKGFTYGQRCTPVSLEDYSLDNISVFNSVRRKAMRASKRSYGNPAFDDPVTITNPLNFAGLSNMANSHSKIDNEYSEVPTVTVKPDELPLGAETKNRYANVIPIPETRVPLRGPDGEDVFINANFVKGAKSVEKFYIACQAPLENTVADFWKMIWEQQAQVILMLTDLHENGVEKCADYLPPSEVLDCHRVFGDLQVTLKKREVREKYIISSIQLRNLESNLWREVIHLWYTNWPIRGVPEDLTSIIAYLIEARSYTRPGHPIVVHCSPGTGRTGTIIAIDTAIRDFETDRMVDIPKTVYGIRRDRAGAVQTNLQYYLIYQVIHLYATKLTGGGLDSI